MIRFPLLAALTPFTPVYGEKPGSRAVNPCRAAPTELPEAVLKAGILDEAVTKSGGFGPAALRSAWETTPHISGRERSCGILASSRVFGLGAKIHHPANLSDRISAQ
jgi:hypothetical protein